MRSSITSESLKIGSNATIKISHGRNSASSQRTVSDVEQFQQQARLLADHQSLFAGSFKIQFCLEEFLVMNMPLILSCRTAIKSPALAL